MKSLLRMQIFYEIAMELGAEADLQKTARKALATYLHKLGCTAGMIMSGGTEAAPGALTPVATVPRNLLQNATYYAEYQKMVKLVSDTGREKFLASLPITGAIGNRHYYVLPLKDFGLIVLVKTGEPFDAGMMHGITGLNLKLAQACLAGLYTARLERDVQARTRDLSETNEKLKESIANIKTLSGLLPICAGCKKIRDDKGYWNQIETYVRAHSDAEFTHGLCPDCMRKYYPAYADDTEDKKKKK